MIIQAHSNILGSGTCCGVGLRAFVISYSFAIGSIVYSIDKANHGRIYAIAIKDIRFINVNNPLYVDTFNSLWNEDELCTESEAEIAIANYQLAHEAALEASKSNCSLIF